MSLHGESLGGGDLIARPYTCQQCGSQHVAFRLTVNSQLPKFCSDCRTIRDREAAKKYVAKRRRAKGMALRSTIWTDELTERLRVLASEGLSSKEIATRLGLKSRNAVIGKCHRLKIPLTKQSVQRTPEQQRAIWRERARKRAEYNRRYRQAHPEKVRAWERKSETKRKMRRTGPKPKDWKPLPTALPNYPPSMNLPLVETGPDQCKFMSGDDFLCCGNKTHNETAYCEHHWRLCHA